MAATAVRRRYLPVENPALVPANGESEIRIRQSRGGVFKPTGFMVYYETGLDKCRLHIALQDDYIITLDPIYLGDIGQIRGAAAEAKIFKLDGLVLPSGDEVVWKLFGNGTEIPAGAVSIDLIGDYTSDGG